MSGVHANIIRRSLLIIMCVSTSCDYVSGSFLQNINPYEDLELYMNWEPNAWNDRPFVVSEGEGMFKHVDKKKWG